MNLLRKLCPKQTIRTLSFVFLTSLFLSISANAQGVLLPPDYFTNIETADSLVNKNNYSEAAAYYLKAFKSSGWQVTADDRYKLARVWAFTAKTDSLNAALDGLCGKFFYWNHERFTKDPAFANIKNTSKFKEIASCFKNTREKYFPEINIEFYNALDSINVENGQNRKRLALAASRKENVALLNEQIHKKEWLNTERVMILLDKYGWPDSASIGFYGNYTLFSMIKPLPHTGYEKYRKMMDEADLKAHPTLNLALIATLDTIFISDQEERRNVRQLEQKYGADSKEMEALWKKITYNDSINLIAVKKIIDTYGWPGPDLVREKGSTTVFLVIQHADLPTQEKYLPLMREAVKNGKAKASSLALLEDRVLTSNGKPQIYGSQLHPNQTTGKLEFYPIEDEANVNKRRAAVGLQPLEDYAKVMGITYSPSK